MSLEETFAKVVGRHASDDERLGRARALLQQAFTVADSAPKARSLVIERIGA